MKPPIYKGMEVPNTTPDDIFDLMFSEHVDNDVDERDYDDYSEEE